jgi:outer membrane protein X
MNKAKSLIMRNITLSLLLVLGLTAMNGQELGKFRVGLDLGYFFSLGEGTGAGGIFLSIEPKYNLTDNSNIGLRLGVATDNSVFGNSSASILGTYDYYFNTVNSLISPFLGVGLGLFAFENIILFGANNSYDEYGALIRGGVELGKVRIALEYNIIPKTDLQIGESVKNSYFGASIGFYVGGGKWKKEN